VESGSIFSTETTITTTTATTNVKKTGEDDDDRWGGCWGEEIINHNISRDADGAENDNAISGWWGKHDEGEASEVKRKKRETKKKEEDEEEEDPWSIFGSSCFEWGGQDRSNEEHCSKNQSMNKLEGGDSSEFISPAVDPDLVAQTIWHIHSTTRSDDGGGGAILVFVGGWKDIVAVKAKLRYDYMLSSSSSSTSNLWRNNRCTTTTTTTSHHHHRNDDSEEKNALYVVGLHGALSVSEQQAAFLPPPSGYGYSRKVVIATAIAETSLTMPDIQYVIDTGIRKQKRYYHANGGHSSSSLDPVWISRAGAEQRKGRAGRVGPGYCYRLYSKKFFEEQMQMFCKPEILRTPLAEVGLQIKALFPHDRIEDILSQLLQPPPAAEIKAAISFLRSSKIIDVEENLTVLGSSLAQLPVSIRAGQLLLYGAAFQCLSPMLTLAASTCTRDVWTMLSDKEEKRKAWEARRAIFPSGRSDHLTLIKAFHTWRDILSGIPTGSLLQQRGFEEEEEVEGGLLRRTCKERAKAYINDGIYASERAFKSIKAIRRQLLRCLVRLGVVSSRRSPNKSGGCGNSSSNGKGGGGTSSSSSSFGFYRYEQQDDDGPSYANTNSGKLFMIRGVLTAALYPSLAYNVVEESTLAKRMILRVHDFNKERGQRRTPIDL